MTPERAAIYAQLASLLRSVLKMGGTYLVADGVWSNQAEQWAVGVGLACIGIALSIATHADTPS